MSAETAAVLDEAANVIRRNGLHKGSFCDDGPTRNGNDPLKWACCTYGAINVASSGGHPRVTSDRGERAYYAVAKHLGLSDAVGNTLGDWNDVPERTVEEVLAALEGAARAERETP